MQAPLQLVGEHRQRLTGPRDLARLDRGVVAARRGSPWPGRLAGRRRLLGGGLGDPRDPACVVTTRSRIVWKLSALAVTSRTPLPTSAPTPRTVATARAISVATSSTIEAISPAAALCGWRGRGSRPPRPRSRRRAGRRGGFDGGVEGQEVGLVGDVTDDGDDGGDALLGVLELLHRGGPPPPATRRSAGWRRSLPGPGGLHAPPRPRVWSAEREAPATCRTTSATDDDSSSAAAATSAPRLACRWASPSMEPARSESAYEVDVSSGTAWRADSRVRRRAPIDRAHRSAVTVPAAPAPASAATETDGSPASQRAIERSRPAAQTAAQAPANPESVPRRSRADRTSGPASALGGDWALTRASRPPRALSVPARIAHGGRPR